MDTLLQMVYLKIKINNQTVYTAATSAAISRWRLIVIQLPSLS